MDLFASNGIDSIFMFIDRMTKMSHFILYLKSITASEFIQLFISHIIRLYSLSNSIISNHSSIFTSDFWFTLTLILNIDLRKSTALHLQTDGKTEWINQTLKTYLYSFCNYEQNDWFELLSLAKFAYNNTFQKCTKISLFLSNYVFHLHFFAESQFLTRSLSHITPAAEEFGCYLHEVHQYLIQIIKYIHSNVHQSSQTGELTGDRPAFSGFGSSSSYNSSKVTGSRITTVTLSMELI